MRMPSKRTKPPQPPPPPTVERRQLYRTDRDEAGDDDGDDAAVERLEDAEAPHSRQLRRVRDENRKALRRHRGAEGAERGRDDAEEDECGRIPAVRRHRSSPPCASSAS